jgi:glycine cleavage system regulatory protein
MVFDLFLKDIRKTLEYSDIMTSSTSQRPNIRDMNTSIVLTVIANDQPGVIQTVSRVVTEFDGSWTQSSMSSLAGHFAGILLVSIPGDKTKACIDKLHGLESDGLRVIANVSSEALSSDKTHLYALDLVGNDRPGIVHDITSLLTRHNVNVLNLETIVEGASMGGGELFSASAELVVPVTTDVDLLESEIEALANDLMVDITFEN